MITSLLWGPGVKCAASIFDFFFVCLCVAPPSLVNTQKPSISRNEIFHFTKLLFEKRDINSFETAFVDYIFEIVPIFLNLVVLLVTLITKIFTFSLKVCISNFLQNYFKSVWCAPIRSSSKNAVIDFVEGQEDCHLSWKNTTTIVCRSKKDAF